MKILVTGTAGFIDFHLAKKLLAAQAGVRYNRDFYGDKG